MRVQFALDVGTEFERSKTPLTTSTELPPWTTQANGDGLFEFTLTPEVVESILGARRYRELLFRIYDPSGANLLGTQMAYVSAATLRGTTTVSLSADPAYTQVTGAPNFVVSGFVTQPDGTPVSGTSVVLSKQNLRSQTPLGTTRTGADGRFLIRYSGTPGGHANSADFSIFVEAKAISATAGHFCNPPADLTVRLVPNNAPYRGRSDFDLDAATLAPLLDTATFDDLSVEDVKFLMCRTELDAATIATTSRAHALALKYQIPAAAFIAFAHTGIPLSTNSVTGLDAQQISDAINLAAADNVVPESLKASIPTITTELSKAKVDRIVPAVDPDSTTLGAILVAASLPAGTPRAFAQAYAAHVGTAEEFWADLRADPNFGDVLVDKIQFTLQTGALSASHPRLVKLLDIKRTANVFTRAAELAQYEEQNWINFFAELVDDKPVHTPPGMAGADSVEKRANYAKGITLMIADLYPSAHLAYRLPPGSVSSQTNVINFVIQNPSFSFQRTVIRQFFPTASGLPALQADKDALLTDLLKVQRVSALSPRFGRTAVAKTLLNQGIISANQIQRMGFAAFKTKVGQSMDSAAMSAVYEAASQVAATTAETWLAMRAETYLPFVAVIPKPSSSDPVLEALFGSLDYCACKPCESVLGPAAYFVDILHFVQQRKPADLLLNTLLNQRPELQHVDLNCENAETALPTIDLINEVLEARAQGYLGLGVANQDRQTTWTAEELLIHPEHLNRPVYTALANPVYCLG